MGLKIIRNEALFLVDINKSKSMEGGPALRGKSIILCLKMLSSLWLRDPAMQMASRRLCSSIRSSEAGLGKRCTFWGRLCVADRALDVGELSLREKVRTEVSLKLVFETLQHLAPRQEITFQQEEQYKELRSSGASEPERQWQLRRGGARCR